MIYATNLDLIIFGKKSNRWEQKLPPWNILKLIKRIIARLDIKNDYLVRYALEGLRILGFPEFFAQKYFEENIDKLFFKMLLKFV